MSLHLAPSLAGEHIPSATTTRAAPKRSHKGREVLVPLTTPLGTFLGPWWHLEGAYPKAAAPPEPTAPQREAEPVAQKNLLCVSFAAWQWEHASFCSLNRGKAPNLCFLVNPESARGTRRA